MDLLDLLQNSGGQRTGVGALATNAFSHLRSSLHKQEALTEHFKVALADVANPEHKMLLAVEAGIANEQFGILNRLEMRGLYSMLESYHPGAYKWHQAAIEHLASVESDSGARAIYEEHVGPKREAVKSAAA